VVLFGAMASAGVFSEKCGVVWYNVISFMAKMFYCIRNPFFEAMVACLGFLRDGRGEVYEGKRRTT
jgi:hypothetical protein